ncbi:hypothetical protein FH972_023625 [Carpinus fangiana]|uniref:HMA domain-containing protein n=1 Tax=Carpinus fangiana TaxID=176857 RepID=A0A5N6KVQ5_9ROSI|nr:hypothetical protein FH972_023625 [Carpinus fangiana]
MATLQTLFLVPNIHCASCGSHIETLLRQLTPEPESIVVSATENSVTVTHHPDLVAQSICDLLESAGYPVFHTTHVSPSAENTVHSSGENRDTEHDGTSYDLPAFTDAVSLWVSGRGKVDEYTRLRHEEHCEACQGHRNADATPTSDTWRATFSVEGMTCASCVSPVKDALSSLPFVQHVGVSLAQNSAVVVHTEESNVELIREAIEDTGKDAVLQEHVNVSKHHEDSQNSSRTVSLRIDGMHCSECPRRIHSVLQDLSLHTLKQATLADPVLSLTYTPRPSVFTIRDIIAIISDMDTSFTVTVNHRPSLEDLQRKMRQQHRRGIILRVWLSVIVAIPAFIIGVVYMNLVPKHSASLRWLMTDLLGVPRAEWAMFVLATVVYFGATSWFITRASKDLWSLWRPGSSTPLIRRFYRFGTMNLLISLGTTIAYVSSVVKLGISAGAPHDDGPSSSRQSYFDSVVFLTMFLLIGRFIEANMQVKVGDAVSALGRLQPSTAILVNDGAHKDDAGFHNQTCVVIPSDRIEIGDVVKIPHGSSPPYDGVLVSDGVARFDEASLTGEQRVKSKAVGDTVYTGTINKGEVVSVRVTALAGGSMLDSIIQVVREGQVKAAPVERVAETLTAYFVPVIVILAVLTWITWLSLGLAGSLPADYLDDRLGGWTFWSLQFAIAVFVIACPCGLGLAAPTALYVGGGIAAKNGILVKGGGEAFQEAKNLNVVVFDKTGTLTNLGKMAVRDKFITTMREGQVSGILRAIEENSSHPLAKALVDSTNLASVSNPRQETVVHEATEIPGKGMKGIVTCYHEDEIKYEALVGNEALLADYSVPIAESLKSRLLSWKRQGWSVVLLALRHESTKDWHVAAAYAAADEIRPEAARVIRALQDRNVQVYMLSGDNRDTAVAVGATVGIPAANVIAGVLPDEKAAEIAKLQQTASAAAGRRANVAMVGDGINDAPALVQANVGIAVASGSDVAVQSAAFVLVKSDLGAILTLVRLSRAVYRRIVFNFVWALAYNMVALPVAAGVLYPIVAGGRHVRLDPSWAALAMALSSISVVGSSLLMRTRLPWVGFREKGGDVEAGDGSISEER